MTTANLRTLDDWLAYIERLHPQTIEMGLQRVETVRARLDIRFGCPVITVGGTNGKGSTCAMLQAVLTQAGYRVGLYASPHLHRFNERARIDGDMLPDEALVRAFELVEQARGDVRLTYFEFTTLAILHLFAEAGLDAVILEVGLGGRLDAVNVIDADVAIVTNVDIDHVDYLGDTREAIGFEKAGIFRSGRTAICGDPQPPESLLRHAQAIGADLRLTGRDFSCSGDGMTWSCQGTGLALGRLERFERFDYPSLPGEHQIANASLALAALGALASRLPVGEQAVRAGLRLANVPGRFQVLPGRPAVILDVAHNPHAAAVLADNLRRMGSQGATHAVFGAMADKDVDGVIAAMRNAVGRWYACDLPLARAATASQLKDRLMAAGVAENSVAVFGSPQEALAAAKSVAGENDKILIFGSFWTVAGATRPESAESSTKFD